MWSVDVPLPSSRSPLEIRSLVTSLDYLAARLVVHDGRQVIELDVLADDLAGAQQYGRERVEALLGTTGIGREDL